MEMEMVAVAVALAVAFLPFSPVILPRKIRMNAIKPMAEM